MSPDELAQIEARVKAAERMVTDLCKYEGEAGNRRWIMSIPARPDYDPDLVIAAALTDTLALLAAYRTLEAETADARRLGASIAKAQAAGYAAGIEAAAKVVSDSTKPRSLIRKWLLLEFNRLTRGQP